MPGWGWLGLLAVPGWLLWVQGVGYATTKQCIEGDALTPPASMPAEREACNQTPSALAPWRGVGFGPDDLTGEYVLFGLVCSLAFLLALLWAARRTARRPAGRVEGTAADRN